MYELIFIYLYVDCLRSCPLWHGQTCGLWNGSQSVNTLDLFTRRIGGVSTANTNVNTLFTYRLFEKHPDVQQLFIHFRGLTGKELRKNKCLREHGLKVLNTLDKCIARVDQLSHLENLLHDLGKIHCTHHIKTDYLRVGMIGVSSVLHLNYNL